MDSVLEAAGTSALVFFCMSFNPSFCGFGIGGNLYSLLIIHIQGFNPSFCGFGIGGQICLIRTFYASFVSILVSVDSVLEGSDRRDASPTRIWFQS